MKRLLGVLMAILMLVTLSACGEDSSAKSGVEDGVLTIAMECAYAPYNWTQTDDSNGAVPIKGTNDYANGYDVMIAKRICEANGWKLEVVRSDWDSLVPSVQTGVIDAVIAGQSMTKERSQQVDFAGPYYYASFAILVKKDSPLANATSIMDFAGYKGSAQSATIWYSECLPQMEGALIQTAAESAPAMIMGVETGVFDFVVTDMPTATGAAIAYNDLKVLDFSGTDGDFKFSEEEREENVNIGISVRKGNTVLKEAIDSYLDTLTVDDFNTIMDEAIKVQPLGE
ncbi:MAG: transporter substrate-binding domain-containing protein [Solobacterium sp.]|nr:transporter substrate-binding domain-containing protein [Solobacterium sp.]MDY3794102.1 transporter substrate-binding domain-containing protein [Erysipelotrichaceae bacterium]MCI6877456.1 transporter substrate-binding domain-containing protein [Solobacterium sp.]MCI7446066.1 transporter substrate-binding domain-containing protein [Solobacterium sp.]MDD5801053.1 transporter substrate-binding domain-containing protein [Solobacterium sp.]